MIPVQALHLCTPPHPTLPTHHASFTENCKEQRLTCSLAFPSTSPNSHRFPGMALSLATCSGPSKPLDLHCGHWVLPHTPSKDESSLTTPHPCRLPLKHLPGVWRSFWGEKKGKEGGIMESSWSTAYWDLLKVFLGHQMACDSPFVTVTGSICSECKMSPHSCAWLSLALGKTIMK